ncbi:uncharacterized protein BDR25DRAFT_228524 [Lindgomyces ingoldianus]|uniref:Uncharacterized protein n=1 Tax=Lindgomyces ingoldianus TaxID=673940 RepID=A0ACB6QU34_9PLEO|nr:uncharacterized protein BDR25DRAFT_228524 [Lindgomyces ingoldianus]KAF2469597.1 hypothetical protein BDR25DRAFT_228524 [Lindgomyces ingoldianus]
MFGGIEDPAPPLSPPSVTIIGARFPADGSPAHLLSLKTTSEGVGGSPDSFLFHVPDLRVFWKTPQAWQHRDVQRLEIENQPFLNCHGVYMVFFSYFLDELPRNNNFPAQLIPNQIFSGDVFVVKLKPHEFGEHAWAAYDDVPPEFLKLPIMGRRY